MSKQLRLSTHPLFTLTRVWLACAAEASALALRRDVGLDEARSLRSHWLSGLSVVADQTMRTTIFLELMGAALHTMSTPIAGASRGARMTLRGGESGGSR